MPPAVKDICPDSVPIPRFQLFSETQGAWRRKVYDSCSPSGPFIDYTTPPN
jgi:hypothetical protein